MQIPANHKDLEHARLLRDLEEGIRRAMRAQNPLKRGREEAEVTPDHDDSAVDIAGYAAVLCEAQADV